MAILKRKKSASMDKYEKRFGAILIPFPRFYIKAVGGQFSIEHRLTHTYLESVDTEAELVEAIKKWNGMSEKELYTYLLVKRYARFPQQNKVSNKQFEHEEEWYIGAWSVYTGRFYSTYPELLEEVESIDYNLLNTIKRERNELAKQEEKKKAEERKRIEEELDIEEKVEKFIPKVQTKRDEVEKKKLKKKLRVKIVKQSDGIGLPIVGFNPFE